MDAPSDALLRTFATVAPGTRVLEVGCGAGHHTQALTLLGLEVHACAHDEIALQETQLRMRSHWSEEVCERRVYLGSPEEVDFNGSLFDWGLIFGIPIEELQGTLRAVRDRINPGGWIYVAMPAVDVSDGQEEDPFAALVQAARSVALAEAQAPKEVHEGDGPYLHAIFRRVEDGTRP